MNILEQEFIFAAEANDLAKVKNALSEGVDIHTHDDYALRWASNNGHFEMVKFLVEHGANIHARDDEAFRWSALRNLDTVKFLLEKGSKIDIYDNEALKNAFESGLIDVVEFLIEKGVQFELIEEHINNTNFLDACEKNHVGIINFFIAHNFNIRLNNDEGLSLASKNGCLEIIDILISHGANIEKAKKFGTEEVKNWLILRDLNQDLQAKLCIKDTIKKNKI